MFEECTVTHSEMIDDIQYGVINEPDPYFLAFWSPEIDLVEGLKEIHAFLVSSNS